MVVLAAGKVSEAPHSGGRLERLPLLHDPVHSHASVAQTDSRVLQSPEPARASDVLVAECILITINGMAAKRSVAYSRSRSITTRTFRSADKDAYHVVIGAHQMNPRVM